MERREIDSFKIDIAIWSIWGVRAMPLGVGVTEPLLKLRAQRSCVAPKANHVVQAPVQTEDVFAPCLLVQTVHILR